MSDPKVSRYRLSFQVDDNVTKRALVAEGTYTDYLDIVIAKFREALDELCEIRERQR